MSLLLSVSISISGIILGKVLFGKWFNHLTFYCFIMGGLVSLYELKLISYPDVTPLTWFIVIASLLSLLLGCLTVTTARNLFSGKKVLFKDSDMSLAIFADKGKTLKYAVFIFSVICLYAGIENWIILLRIFGSIPAVFIHASTVYHLNTHREIKGLTPLISIFGYVAVFFSAIYTAYKGRFSFLTFFPFVGVVIREMAATGRAGMLLALMEFLITFLLFRHLLHGNSKFKFSKGNAIVALTVLITFFITSASLVRITRGASENYSGLSKSLREYRNNFFISPSLYLYLSSDVGVLTKYLSSDGENTKFGQNTLLPFYFFLAKAGVMKRINEFQKGYFVPVWTNTGTYIRELHADFGITGVFLGSYLLGLLITWLWYRFYERKNLIVFAFLVYFYLIIGFSFLVMVTRIPYWSISLVMIIIAIPVIEIIAKKKYRKSLSK